MHHWELAGLQPGHDDQVQILQIFHCCPVLQGPEGHLQNRLEYQCQSLQLDGTDCLHDLIPQSLAAS